MDETIKQLSIDLKSLCEENGKEKDHLKCAEIFYQMGKVYKKLSDNCDDKHEQKISYIRCAVLLNAAIVRKPKNSDDIKAELSKLCSQILTRAKAEKNKSDLVEKSEQVLLKIHCLRKEVESVLEDNESTNSIDLHKKVTLIEGIQNNITNEYRLIMQDIMEYCISIKGTPPCKYALIAMGSLARNEITPYSDFEHAYILEDNIQTRSDYEDILDFFRWVSVIFHLIVINLGETIVPNVSLPHVNDQMCKENDWFFDENTPRGISFDGMMPHACKFPLGRSETKNKKWKTELIKPVSEMLKYLEIEEAEKNGYRLAEVLLNSCYVSGSHNVYSAYQQGIMERNVFNLKRVSAGLDVDFKNFSPLTTLPTFHQKQVFDVKRLIYRSTSLFVAALGYIHQISVQSSFDIVRRLHNTNVITAQMKENLLFALSLACEARLRVYMKRKGQYDLLDVKEGNDDDLKWSLFKMLGEDNVVAYFETALKLQSLVLMACEGNNDKTTYDLDKLNKVIIFYWLKKYNSSITECQMLLSQLPEDDDSDKMFCLHTMFYCFVNLKQFKDATEIYDRVGQIAPNCCIDTDVAAMVYHEAATHEVVDDKHIFIQKEIELRKILLSKATTFPRKYSCCVQLGGCLLKCSEYKEALKYFEQAESLIQQGKISIKAQLVKCQMEKAKCYYHLNNIEKAISYFDSALLRLNILQRKDSTNKDYLEDIATCHLGLGKSYFKSEDYTQCFEHLTTASSMWIDLGSSSNLDVLIVTLSMLGEELMKQHKYSHVVTCFELESDIRKHSNIGLNDHHINADRCFGMGCCFYKLDKIDKALEWLRQAKKVLLLIHDKNVQRDIAHCDAMLGAACLGVEDYENALSHSHACLDVISKTEVGYVAYCYFTIGQCLLHFNDHAESLNALQSAKKFFEKQNNCQKIKECENLIESCKTSN